VVTTGLSARASATGAQAHQRLIVAALEHRSARVDDKGVQQIAAETRKLAERIAKIEADAAKRLLRTRVRARHRVRHDGRTSSAVSRRNTCSPRTANAGRSGVSGAFSELRKQTLLAQSAATLAET
jgi:hypothetical protein